MVDISNVMWEHMVIVGTPPPQPGPPTPTMGLRFTALGAAPVGLEATIFEAPAPGVCFVL